jgi:hypothetical protein
MNHETRLTRLERSNPPDPASPEARRARIIALGDKAFAEGAEPSEGLVQAIRNMAANQRIDGAAKSSVASLWTAVRTRLAA